MVLVAAAIVFAGLGFISLPDSAAEPASQDVAGVATTTDSAGPSAQTGDAAAASGGRSSTTATTTTAGTTSTRSDRTGTDTATASESVSESASGGAADGTSAAEDTPVRVYNNSTVDGLAHQTAEQLKADGFTVGKIANYDGGKVPHSAVYYGQSPGEKDAAEEVGAQLGIPAEPRFDGIDDASPGVIVILTAQG